METNNRYILFVMAMMIAISGIYWSCATVPITGRRQLSLVPESELMAMSYTQYNQFLEEHKLSENQEQVEMVKRVGGRIAAAVEQYFAQRGWSDQLTNFQWEFNLVEDDTPNAWCMPGGKVVFYTGILPITRDEEGLAVVMGHEIAHAVAKHGSERMSQQIGIQFGAVALSALLSEKPEETQNLYMAAYGVTSQVGLMLPYSRKHEHEADRLGLIFMAMAGYDPSVAVDFWQRMAQLSQGGSPPAFLSTHPSDQARVNYIREVLPEALEYYNP
ncbi:M48 family metallopeptidase [Natronoflexus pectinivorans]|uniref:Peptidase M48-like protein n=1 Tax=Natronoflexus pectinivorans TaxID=682526 RepID=A0A4V2RWL9_9BACT|nr:M48 family metallopeptidase [Natronoflexus pectinivorans]TCO09130.1 peptidase M48-like protein [Natronoflexus pectinivorans]